jgi:putative IMPACT (imprinted ancient) family translation regulator
VPSSSGSPSRAFRTLSQPARRETRVRGSRFLADAHPAPDEATARERRRALAAEFPDATHHCWALRLRKGDEERALSDDAGEPAGTAGVPILQAIRRADLLDTQVIVVRWFGGVRLGKGGLARAYRDAARLAIEAAAPVERVPLARLRLVGPVGADGEIRHALARLEGAVIEAGYTGGGRADLLVSVPEARVEALRGEIGHLTRGSWRIEAVADP